MDTSITPSTLTNSGSQIIRTVVDVEERLTPRCELRRVYDIEKCGSLIKQNGYKNIAMQFPDEIIGDAADVAALLQEYIGDQTCCFILADTSYGSCCADEVAAEHLNADIILHYGRSCLSFPTRLPVYHVFPRSTLDVLHVISEFKRIALESWRKWIVLLDTSYVHYQDEIQTLIRSWSSDHGEFAFFETLFGKEVIRSPNHEATYVLPGRTASISSEMKDYTVFFIGEESQGLVNAMLTLRHCAFFSYRPSLKTLQQETLDVSRLLQKRYYLVQKARDANVFGLLIGTMGVSSYKEVLEQLKKLISTAGRRYYTFLMGKLNTAKLANFPEIDSFVMIACPENSLIDSKDFLKPVITPFELELALSRKPWTGDFQTDFQKILPRLCQSTADLLEPEHPSDDEPDFSLISGQLKARHVASFQPKDLSELGQLTYSPASDKQLFSANGSAAAEFFAQRNFQGLEPKIGETEATLAVEGRRGTAKAYNDEKELLANASIQSSQSK